MLCGKKLGRHLAIDGKAVVSSQFLFHMKNKIENSLYSLGFCVSHFFYGERSAVLSSVYCSKRSIL